MTLDARPTRRLRHPVQLDASVTRSGGFVLKTIVTDFSLEGCCLLGHFQPAEIIEVAIRRIGRLPAQIQWVKRGRAGARFLNRREQDPKPPASFQRLLADNRGVAAIEYAFLATLIAVALIGAFATLGDRVGQHFTDLATAVEHGLQSTFDTDDDEG